jgi:O-acetylhomoserine/O-acetylserine sulfhydrylase-like pyridoxal-dependent enzyme
MATHQAFPKARSSRQFFLTSTFVFENAQQGKDFFDLTSGCRPLRPGEKAGLVYSRFNNPNLEILEDRLAIWDLADTLRRLLGRSAGACVQIQDSTLQKEP